ncbi:MAG: neutral/alkaline non-lysosomal ceramidase N-terminal domain-containing protein [Planctomycetia bacterium]|nr:neutral/alkaline non-lysosomal ceramidase N-terminal domain-containing protein [Planctomycetia bacterium]
MYAIRLLLAIAALVAFVAAFQDRSSAADQAPTWKAGAAKTVVTPRELLWMSGYGGRDHPAEGKLTDLWAKALAIEDSQGRRAVVITLDLVGIPRETSLAVREAIGKKHNLKLDQIAICTSHTHTGPVVRSNLRSMYFLDDAMWNRIETYEAQLRKDIVAVADEAFSKLAPSRLAWGIGKADFAVNRRENPEADVPALREQDKLKGPVDHDVPVLKVTGADGKLTAVLFGYACHATVLSFYQWSGDYPGFAQIALEEAHPGAVALFWAGCGADQNPLPRRTVELAKQYGQRLAKAVDEVLQSDMMPIRGKLATAYREIDLAFAEIPTREKLEADAKAADKYVARRATLLLAQLDKTGKIDPTYPYPVQAWRIGDELLFVTLGGEVVVDFSLRLKRELGAKTFVAGYSNDVMAYIPSLRVLREGRYEGGGAMVYYGLPSPWGESVEEDIVRAVHELVMEVKKK